MNVPLKLILCFLIISIITYFFYLGPHYASDIEFFGEMASGFQSLFPIS